MCPAASFGERRADIDRCNLVADLLLFFVGHGVRDDDAAQAAVVDVLDGVAGEDTVDDDGVDFPSSVLHHSVGCLDESTAGIRHVVNDDGDLIFDVTNEHHAGNLVGTGTFLVDQGELRIQPVSDASGSVGGKVSKIDI